MSSTVSGPGAAAVREPVAIPDHVLLRVIGRGSYGEIWEARNVMGTPRAVKVVRRQDFQQARPFEREFEGIQRYEPMSRSHAGLVQVLHVGMGPEGAYFYYVMELGDREESDDPESYVPRTLRGELLRQGALPVTDCLVMGMALASALGHLHRNGLVHRDVKPSNIIYVNGAPKLADAGLVAGMSDSRSMVGTEGYFAPEGTGQPRSDVYSLGKVLYECVTGLDRQQFPDVPEEWDAGPETRPAFEFMEIVLRAAESDPARRYPDTDEMLAELALLQAGKSLRYLRRVETRLKRMIQILTIAAMVVSVAGGAWLYEWYRRGQVEAAEARAVTANQNTRQLLAESLLAEARAVRLSGQAGARRKALAAVDRALKAGAPLFDLRTQAASALALTDVGDLQPGAEIKAPGQQVRWSPEGDFAVIADPELGRIRVLDRSDATEAATFETQPGVLGLWVSRGAEWIATSHAGYELHVWNRQEGQRRWSLAMTRQAPVVGFSGDGSWLITATDQGLIACRCADGAQTVLRAGTPPFRDLQLAPDGRWIAALPEPREMENQPAQDLGFRIYHGLPGGFPDPDSTNPVQENALTSDIRLEGASISADSRYLAAAVSEDRLRIWEMPSMSQVAWLRGHQRSVRGTAFHPEQSSIVASTSWDGTTRLWDIPTRQQILVVPQGGEQVLLAPGRGEVLVRTWAGDALRCAPLSSRNALQVMMLPSVTPTGLFAAVHFSPDGSLLAAAGASGVIVWDRKSGRAFTAQPHGKPDEWRFVRFSPRDGSLYFCGGDGVFRRTVHRAAGGAVQFGPRELLLPGFSAGLKWSGERLAVSGRLDPEGNPGVDLISPDGTVEFLPCTLPPDRLAGSGDGRWLAAATYPGGGGTLWDLATIPPQARTLQSESRASFGFSPDSRVLITGTDRRISFSSVQNPDQEVAPTLLRYHSEFVPAHNDASPAAGLTAISTGPNEITLCDGATLTPLLALETPLTPFDCHLSFSPDGKTLAMAGGVSRVILWDIEWIRQQLTSMGLGW